VEGGQELVLEVEGAFFRRGRAKGFEEVERGHVSQKPQLVAFVVDPRRAEAATTRVPEIQTNNRPRLKEEVHLRQPMLSAVHH
jgi:hypothetical protein